MDIDYSKLPEPLAAEADEPTNTTNPLTIPQRPVENPGQPFPEVDFSKLPEPLPAERGTLADMGVALGHGVESAARETVKTFGSMLNQTVVPPFMREKVGALAESLMPAEIIPQPETTVGKIESDLIRFGLGFLAGGTVVKGAGALANIGKSAVGTGAVSDPHAERLANIIEQYPSLSNPVTDYLAAKDTDGTAEGKFKASLEDVLTNSVAQLAFKVFKTVKASRSGKATEAEAADMAEDILKAGPGKTTASTATHSIDPVIVAEKARQAVTPAWSPLKLSDEKALQFREKLDSMFKDKSIEATPANDGTISVAHMDSRPDVLTTVQELSKMIEPEMKAVGFTAHQTNQATKELAEQLGTDPEALLGGLKAMGSTADQIAPMVIAGRMAMQGLSSNIAKLSERALVTGEGKESALAAVKQLVEVMSEFKALQTGVARGLQTFGVKVGAMDVTALDAAMQGKHGDDLLNLMVQAENDPTVIAKLAQAASTSWVRKGINTHNELWINALLSGPKTHLVNMTSTTLNMLMQPLNLVVGGSLKRDWAEVREGVALWTGLRTHIFESLTMARKSFLTDSQILSGNTTNELKTPAISAANYGLDPDKVIGQGLDALGKFVRLSTRFLGSEDEFFKQLAYRTKLHAQGSREALEAIKAGKLDQKDFASFVEDYFKKGFNEHGAALNESALKYAERSTFTQDLKIDTWIGNRSFGESISSLANTHPVLRGTVLPFTRVPTNLMRQVQDYSPTAFLKKQFWSDIQAGGQRQTEAIGRISIGSTMWVAAGFYAADGSITGAPPADKDLRAQLEATGWQPYSIKVGDSYISYNRLDPFGSVLGLMADYHQISGGLPEDKRDELATIMTLSLTNNLVSKSYLKGLIDTLTIVGSNDPNKIHRWVNQRAASYVPNALAATNADREMKEVRGVLDAMASKVPGWSSTVEAKRDLFGEKRLTPSSYPYSAFNPFPTTEERKDPVRSELARLATSEAQAQFSTPPTHIGNVDLSEVKLPSGQSAYDRYTELIGKVTDGSGRTMHTAMLDKMRSDAYRRGTDGDSWYETGSRVSMLRTVHDKYKDRALMELKRELPSLADALRKDKENRLKMKKGREAKNPIEAILNLEQ